MTTRIPNTTEWSTEARTSLAFRVNNEQVQSRLPNGWEVAPSPGAATKGANVTVTLMERFLVLDPDDKPKGTGTLRYVVLSAPARHSITGDTTTMVFSGISPEGRGVYDVFLPGSELRVDRTSSSRMAEGGTGSETWLATAMSGDQISVNLRYRRGLLTRARLEAVIRSAAHPEYRRTYYIEQASDILRSIPAGVDRLDELTFSAKGAAFEQLFAGSELVAVTSVPYYVRTVTVP